MLYLQLIYKSRTFLCSMRGTVLCIILFSIVGSKVAHALECLSCSDVNATTNCHVTKTCSKSEHCYTRADDFGSSVVFSLGCRPSSQCFGESLVGRDLFTRDFNASPTGCNQCCSVDYCNRDLCSHSGETLATAGSCADSPEYNCKLISSTFNICRDVQHAKNVCRLFCGLCDLIDGIWGQWGEWSLCEKTCGVSQKVRVRACDDPAPAHGGLDCTGSGIEYKNCSMSPCPVSGGWSGWSSWSTCSQTCGVGLLRRSRTCSNPYPDYGGDHCFGDAVEDKICYGKPCTDGGWSTWNSWGTCTVTCNGGLKSRQRTCSNPKPSLLGKQCVGNNEEYASCNAEKCPVSSSSVRVYFSVNTPTGHLYSDHHPVFSKIVINEGNAYDISTGTFKVPVPGIYQFFVTFVTTHSTTQCFIRKNRVVLVYALTTANTDWKSASASTYVHCAIGDVIDISCGGWEYVDHNQTSMFSGALVSAD